MVFHPCSCCSKTVANNQKALLCTDCCQWTHISCGHITRKQYDDVNELFKNWKCPMCILRILPFWGEDLVTEDCIIDTDTNVMNVSLPEDRESVSSFPKEKGIKVAHLNIRSLRNKTVDLRSYLLQNPYDVLGISETWLNEDISNDTISIDGFTFERKDRNGLGGGVGCFIQNKYTYVRRKDLENNDLELMWLEIKRTNSSSIFVGICYRKPDSNTLFFNNFEESIDHVISISENVMILSDLNCNMMTENNLSKKVHELCTTTQLKQIIKDPTRITPHSTTLIDLIFVTHSVTIVESGVQCIGFSDHSLIYFVMKGSFKCHSNLPKISKFRSFRYFDEHKFRRDLSEIEWDGSYYNENSVQSLWDRFKSLFVRLSDTHAPIISVRRKQKGVPWITDEYLKLARERDYYRKRFKKTNLVTDWDKFKHYRNRANNMNKYLKRDFYEKEFIKCGNDINKNWKIMKDLLPKKNGKTDFDLIINGEIVTDNSVIANKLNEAFNNVSERLGNNICNNSDVNSMGTLFRKDTQFRFKDVTVEFVRKELLNIDCKKAVGLDGLHPKLLKLAAEFICRPLAFLFNKSLQTSEIPMDFKVARVTAIHKGGSYEIDNFRPISILPILSKILEKAVHTQLYSYLNDNKMLSPRQSGFRPSHSTATCVTDIIDYLLENMNDKQITGAISLDLKKSI